MIQQPSAAERAAVQVEATRDDPAGRLALLSVTYRGPYGHAPQHLPFRRAALSFMRWQLNRGVLNPLTATPPGSPWWRAINERILRDTCETVARSGGLGGEPSSSTIELGTRFVEQPTATNWYRAHNASVVAAYLEHRDLAWTEAPRCTRGRSSSAGSGDRDGRQPPLGCFDASPRRADLRFQP